MTGDRGLSDLVGFVLVFGIVVTAVGLTVTFGQGQLAELRNSEQADNAERALVLLSQQFDSIESGEAVARSGQFKIGSGVLGFADRTDIVVRVSDDAGNRIFATRLRTGSLTYRISGSVLAYESGAVIRRPADGSGSGVVVTRPQFTCLDGRAFVSVVTLTGDLDTALSGGTGIVTARLENRTVVYPGNRTGRDTAEDAGSITVEFPGLSGDSAWQFLAQEGNWQALGGGAYRCDGIDAAYVRQTTLNVSISN